MEYHQLEQVMSSSDEQLWVTLGFSSTLEHNDVLHIVPGAEPDGSDGLYLERFDQSYSIAGGARSIVVTPRTISIQLTDDARRELAFESTDLVFEAVAPVAGYQEAVQMFRKMALIGYPIRVEIA